jgi:serine/threonine-protein kinase
MRLEREQIVDGRYRLVGRVGSGGMADVWLAEDQLLHRSVALKFLHDRFAQDQKFVERFRREATAAAGLQHPNIVAVYDRGQWEGAHYIAMEYVEGASLKDLIARGLSVGEAVEMVRQILSGAAFAHEHGVIHRDFKPQNVLVDAEGRARVTDFGIARAGASEITQAGSVLGTAQYLSPEQAQGQEVTAASDIYSIGVILYEALTGRLPFEAESPVAVALKQISERPRPPSELNPEVSPALDAVVLRALAKDPANRYGSALEFQRALDAAEADPQGAGLGDTAAYAAIGAGALAGAAAAGAETAVAPEGVVGAPPDGGAPGADEEEQGWRRWLHGWRLAALIAALLLLLFGAVLVYALTRPDQVTVPTVLEKSAGEARAILEGRGFDVDILRRPACANPGQVLEQSPSAGEKADEGSTVTLTVSTGQQVEVPEVRGLLANVATKRLKHDQLLVRSKQRFSGSVDPGRAIATRPAAGEEVACNDTVTLLVSQGANLVTVPSVVGLEESEAEARLEDRGLIVNVDTRNADEPEGQVIDQDPGPGSRVKRGRTVTVTVSTGAGSVVVPDVIGQPEATARSILAGRGVTNIKVVRQTTDDESQDGRVTDQAPDAGTRIRSGEQVTIFVAKFVAPPETTTTSTTTTSTDTGTNGTDLPPGEKGGLRR